jgi:selenocysteine-specific elongation factor
VTGSLVTGTLSRDQKLELLPARQAVRVRRLEVHGREVAEARAGERVSANLAGIELTDVRRGVVLAVPGAFATSALLTARLELLAGAPPVKSGDRVSFHHYSSEARAVLRILEGNVLRGGETGRVQLRLSQPVAAVPGDRFVVRRLSPVETIGGGAVLDPLWPPVRRATPEVLAELGRLDGSLAERLVAWVEQGREEGVGEESLAARAGVSREEVRALVTEPAARERVRALRHSPERYIAEEVLARLAIRARAEIEKGIRESSGAVGVSRGTLLARLLPSADPRWTEALEKELVLRGAYLVAGDEARLPGREDLGGVERELSERVADAFRRRGLDPPSIADVTREVGHKQKVVEGLAAYLVKKGSLLRLPGGWIIAREPVEDVIARLRASGKTSLDVGEFKEMFGLTRRLAIPLLEYLDGAKVTRRVGDRREIVKKPGAET